MSVSCEIEETELEGDYGMVAGIQANCSRCGRETESFGTSESSILRCLALMRDECPAGESNFYVPNAPRLFADPRSASTDIRERSR